MKIFKATYLVNAQPVIEAFECVKIDDLYVYTQPTIEQINRYNSTKLLKQLKKQANGMINHFAERGEAVEYMDKYCQAQVKLAFNIYQKLKDRHLLFLNDC